MNLKQLTSALKPSQVMGFVSRSLGGPNSKTTVKLMNLLMPQVIPFNRTLGLRIRELTADRAEVEIPFKRANKNHLGGLHACAIATVGEYTAGLLVMRRTDPSRQRIVLKTLHVDFTKQGRVGAVAVASWPEGGPHSIETLKSSDDAHEIAMTTLISSGDGTEIAKVGTVWQVKPWAKVKKKGAS